ncbi:unnamed protein product [Danaus chrysippus]|uniref:(African queen) hypothetical protein n=1 Tax=Danaus chrysippus TaxID=151541 RepID=A0A8J2R183_9NEOP|nr:unnamed protein product [Danaus chrysippus]
MYAEEVPGDGGSARRWYLLHFAVTHPTKKKFKTSITGEEKEAKHLVAVVSPSSLPTPDPVRFSRWVRLLRVTARVLQFVQLCRRERTLSTRSSDPVWTKKHNKTKTKAQHSAPLAIKERYSPLEPEWLKKAEELLLRRSQECFKEERKAVESQQPLDRKSKLKRLDIAVNDGLIRIRGRIDAAEELDRDLRQPVVLDTKDDITKLILTHYHDKFNHERPSSKIVRLVSQPTVEDKIAEQQRGGPEQLRVAGQEDGAKHEGEDVGDAANI